MGKTGYSKRGIEGGIEPGYRQGVSDQGQDEETGFFCFKQSDRANKTGL